MLGFDFFGSGTLSVSYPARTIHIERPIRPQKGPGALIEGLTATLEDWEISLSWPDDAWSATADTPLPSMPLIVRGPSGAELSVTCMEAAGLSPESAQASLELSVPAQIVAYEAVSSGWVDRAGGRAFRMTYRGADERGRPIVGVTEALLRERGLLVLTSEAPSDSAPSMTESLESIFGSLRARD